MGSNIRKGDTGALNPPVYGDAAQWQAEANSNADACVVVQRERRRHSLPNAH